MAIGGALLRISQTLIRALQLCCAIVACGVFAYFLAILAQRDLPVATYVRAVTGMSGAAIIYTAFAVLLTLCFAGVAFLGYLAIFLDICFIGCFAAIAYFSRGGARGCSANVDTPLGNGPSDSGASPRLGTACRLNTAVFAVSIFAILLFILSAILQFLMIRNHKKEKRYGPSPSNNYTSGPGKTPFWKRNRNKRATRDAELATAPGTTGYGRPSHETGFTDTTMVGGVPEPKYGQPGYGQPHGQTAHAASTNYYQGQSNAATNY
ncbi:hypothetical protein EPUS_02740 [Endocarpon pusillum Z07020]|uniref:MARVEL domain-containing protein n=1 Tax=Endocarpon pusillum (strain Z07020 / HMAS-L-300199) TaxID=1263415 RepID=U1HHF9_ENDPU|nr:uncharacterized protein EPUS_02740 [Endocarpon pusillum Z07020]ERF68284.1 hypothetical protein EPUS_02740 [Endocarpon pusillum Z07020]